jgi:Putative DNA-binding domain
MLADFQRCFAAGLLKGREEQTVSNDFQVDTFGYGVHAHQAHISLNIAIENVFPIVRRVVGVNFFAEMAGQFVITHPPTHGWLSAYGEEFPEFVARYSPSADLTYLSDLARIEWARVRAANAPDDPSLDLKSLMTLKPAALACACLRLHGAASLVCSPFPVFDIWQAHQHAEDDEMAEIDIANGSQDVLIARVGSLEVGVALLGPGDAAFLMGVIKKLTFETACQAAVSAEMNYDLGSRLGNLVYLRALAAFAQE